MKKQAKKKLSLHRETLNDLEIRQARGGVQNIQFTEPPYSGCVGTEFC